MQNSGLSSALGSTVFSSRHIDIIMSRANSHSRDAVTLPLRTVVAPTAAAAPAQSCSSESRIGTCRSWLARRPEPLARATARGIPVLGRTSRSTITFTGVLQNIIRLFDNTNQRNVFTSHASNTSRLTLAHGKNRVQGRRHCCYWTWLGLA